MQAIRRALLVRYPTLKEAFDAFARDFPPDRGLTKPDWRNMLSRHGFTQFSGRKEINEIFKSVESMVDGYVTLKEFHTAIELIAPVRTFEGLRRKWLAQGFTSMAQAFRKMDADDSEIAAKRLDLAEFAGLMRKAGVEEDGEHSALFDSLCDSSGTASIEEVHSAVAMVSPSLLLEDLRERLLKRYKGSLEKAFFDLDLDHGGSVSQKEFVARGMQVLDLTRNEAEKAFREIDIDNSGDISIDELTSAMALVDPSLLFEDLRLKVRQRFRSIQEVLNKAFADEVTTGLEQEVRLSRSKFQRALRPLGLTDKETADLFDLIDNDGDGLLTPLEFVRGVRRFAPAGVFEDLRIRCCQTYGHVRTAFASVKTNRSLALAYPAFTKRLASLQLLEDDEDETKDYVNLQAVFDLLDVHHEGVASIGRLVAALSSCGAGARVKLPREESDQRAREEIHSDVSSAFRIVHELRRQVRYGLSWEDAQADQLGVVEMLTQGITNRPGSRGGQPSSPATATSAATAVVGPALEIPVSPPRQRTPDLQQGGRSPLGRCASAPAGAARSDSVTSATATTAVAAATQLGKSPSGEAPEAPRSLVRATAPRLKTVQQEDLPEDVKAFTLALDCRTPSESAVLSTQECWSNIWGRLREPPQQLRPKAVVEKELHSYFQGAAMKMSQDVPLLSKFQSRFATHQTVRLAQGALKPAKSKKPK